MRITIALALVLFCLCSISACGGGRLRALTPADYERELTMRYERSQTICFAGARAGLVEVGHHITSEDDTHLETDRKTYQVQTYSMATVSSHDGGQTKFEVEVTGDGYRCVVRVSRFRVWQDDREIQEFDFGYARQHFWRPVMQAIDEEIRALQP